jgi:hypothetical protein
MSANNYILITENKNGYVATLRDVETNCNMGVVAKAKNLKKVILEAQEFITVDMVEYYLWFKFKKGGKK